jgi:hypothetical protein
MTKKKKTSAKPVTYENFRDVVDNAAKLVDKLAARKQWSPPVVIAASAKIWVTGLLEHGITLEEFDESLKELRKEYAILCGVIE